MNRWGVRYVVVALGSPEDRASDADIEFLASLIETPFKKVILSDNVSDKLTIALFQEQGVLSL